MAGTSAGEPTGGRRFSLLRTLGEGSFGSVYLAEMEGAGGFRRRVALKLLNDTWAPGSDAARRLRDEARLLGRLEHRNIVRVDDLVQLDGRWALVMEYVSGADMERVFAWAEETNTRLSPRAIAELGVAVASALDAAWNAPGEEGEPLRVVHRDIKPSNVRLADNGDVKVLDFGVARAAFAGREARTERVRYGSLGYMAPERLLGEPDTAAGDVYALGVMLYELLTNKLYGRAELGIDRQLAQVQGARDALLAVLDDVAFVALVESMLAYAPEARPASADLADALRTASAHLPGDDLVRLARDVLPKLAAAPAQDGVRGTVLEESGPRTTDGGSRVSSATLVVDPRDFDTSALVADAPDTPPPAPARPAWLPYAIGAGVLAVLGLVAIALWGGGGADEAAPIVTDAAPVATDAAPVATDPAPTEAPTGASATGAAPTEAPTGATPTASSATDAAGTGRAATASSGAISPADAAPAGSPGATAAAPTGASKEPRKTSSRPATPDAAVAPVTAATAAPPAPTTGPRLRAAKFTLAGAEGIQVTCGDVSGTGATSTLLRDFPAGDCAVVVGGHTARVRLDSPRGVACTVEGDSLTCR